MKKMTLLTIVVFILGLTACFKEPQYDLFDPSVKLVTKITEMRLQGGVYTKEVTFIDYNSEKKPALVRTYTSSYFTTDTANLVFTYSDTLLYDNQGRVREAIRYDIVQGGDTRYGRRYTYAGTDTLPAMLASYDSTGNLEIFVDTASFIYATNQVKIVDHNDWGNDTSLVTYVNGNFYQYVNYITHTNYDTTINIERCFNVQHGNILLLPFQDVRVPILSLNNWRRTTNVIQNQVLTYDSENYVSTIYQAGPGQPVRNFTIDYITL